MRTVLQRIEHALTFCKEYADGSWSIATEKFRHHVTPDLLEDTRRAIVRAAAEIGRKSI